MGAEERKAEFPPAGSADPKDLEKGSRRPWTRRPS